MAEAGHTTETSDALVARARSLDLMIPAGLFAGAALGWWWSVRMAADMDSMGSGAMDAMDGMASMSASHTMSLAAYMIGWVAMMAAMMFPAISPMVKIYAKAAAKGNVAPVPFFVAGYLIVWAAIGFPAYFAWRELAGPLDEGAAWVGRLAGGTFLIAGLYQLTPLKSTCLTHCRSPISFFIHHARGATGTPLRAARLGAVHGSFCLGCCWAMMAVLVAVGTMNLVWMGLIAALILIEKVSPRGETVAAVAAVAFALVGVALLADPASITTLT